MQITAKQVEAAKAARLRYFWRIELHNGEEVSQFDPETGAERRITDHAQLLVKPPDDKYTGAFAFKGIRRAFWIPVSTEAVAHGVELGSGEAIVLYRQNRLRTTGTTYFVYCLGVRYDGPVEEVFRICPPTRYLKHVDSWLDEDGPVIEVDPHYFPGAVSISTLPSEETPFDDFVRNLS